MEESNNGRNEFRDSRKRNLQDIIFWILGVILVFLIAFFAIGKPSNFVKDHLWSEPVETYWDNVKNTMLRDHDIQKFVIIDNEKVLIYLKKSSYERYADKLGKGFSSPSINGPHFTFFISSPQSFNYVLQKTQSEFNDKEKINVEYKKSTNHSIWIILIMCFIYFIPSMIGRRKKNRTAIFILNLFLGWTYVGWVVALVWAVMKE